MCKTLEEENDILELLQWYSSRGVDFLKSIIKNNSIKSKIFKYRAWFDGSFKQLESLASISFFIADETGVILYQYSKSFKVDSFGSTFAESTAYKALLDYIDEQGLNDVIVYGDCKHVMEVEGYQINENRYVSESKNIELIWIPRYLNFHSDRMCTESYDVTFLNNKDRFKHIKDIFTNTDKVKVAQSLLEEGFIFSNRLKLSEDNNLNYQGMKNIIENKIFYEENCSEVFLFSIINPTDVINLSLYQVVRLLDRGLIFPLYKNILVTYYPLILIKELTEAINLLKWDLKNNYDFSFEDRMFGIKKQQVTLVFKISQEIMVINTKQAKYLLLKNLVKIYAENVLVTIETKNLIQSYLRNYNYDHINDMKKKLSITNKSVTLFSLEGNQSIIISAKQAKKLINRGLAELIEDNKLKTKVTVTHLHNFADPYSLAMWTVRNKFKTEINKNKFWKTRSREIVVVSKDGQDYIRIPTLDAMDLVINNKATILGTNIIVANSSILDLMRFNVKYV